MNRFSDEVRIIPVIAWIIALLVAVCLFVVLFTVTLPHDAKMSHWPTAGQIAFSIWPGLLVGTLILLVGYINADARRRGMRYVMWTLLAIFLPNSVGIILYFILRDPLPGTQCPKCGAQGRPNFTYCPHCGVELTASGCPSCKRLVEPGWKSCPYCRCALGAGTTETA
jgi:hypothetical protein